MHRDVKPPTKPRIPKFTQTNPQSTPLADYDELELSNGTYSVAADIGSQTDISVTESLVVKSDLSTRTLTHVARAEFRDTKFVNTVFEGKLKDVRFVRCKLSRAIFEQDMALERVEFIDCEITDCSFYKAVLRDISFIESRFTGVGFDAAIVHRVSLVSSTLAISDPSTLKRCTITSEQAAGMVAEMTQTLGIIVTD